METNFLALLGIEPGTLHIHTRPKPLYHAASLEYCIEQLPFGVHTPFERQNMIRHQ